MREKIKQSLEQTNFSNEYVKICNDFDDIKNGKIFKKNEIIEIIRELESRITYVAKDKTFYHDYQIENYKMRFSLTYKNGFIECFYYFLDEPNEERIRGRFNSISAIIDEDFRNKVRNNFPIATSGQDLKIILTRLLKLHNCFIENFTRLLDDNVSPMC